MYKYRIEEILDKLPQKERTQSLKDLGNKLQISQNRLWRIRTAKVDSNVTAKVSQLQIIATHLEINIVDLLNSPVTA